MKHYSSYGGDGFNAPVARENSFQPQPVYGYGNVLEAVTSANEHGQRIDAQKLATNPSEFQTTHCRKRKEERKTHLWTTGTRRGPCHR